MIRAGAGGEQARPGREWRPRPGSAVGALTDRGEVWLSALIEDQPVDPNLVALRSLAGLLMAPEPNFVAAGIRHILEKERRQSLS